MMLFLPEAISLMGDHLELVPIVPNGKRPLISRWEKGLTRNALADIASKHPTANVGTLARLRPGLDIDVLDEECASAIQFAAEIELGVAPVRTGQKPKRLMMYSCSSPFRKARLDLLSPSGEKHCVEFLADGQQYVVGGIHPSGSAYEWSQDDWWLNPGPDISEGDVLSFFDALPEYLPGGWSVFEASRERDSLIALAQSPLDGWSANRITEEVLPYLDLECHYDDWLMAGQALHHQFEGGEEGFQLWDSAFCLSSKYAGEEYGREKWASFGTYTGPVVTLASLIHLTKDKRQAEMAGQSKSALDEIMASIAAVSEPSQLEVEVAPKIRSAKLLDVDREVLISAIRERSASLGVRLTAAIVRRWVKPMRRISASPDMPDWATSWVFCSNGDKFFSLTNKQLVSMMGFRAMYNRMMPVDPETGARRGADSACLEDWDMPVVGNLAYVPWAGPVFEMNGSVWGNLYRDDLVPDVPVVLTSEDMAVVRRVEEHAEKMFPDKRERELFLSWCAWQVQRPGEKVRWAPYLFGVEGDGKSFWATLVGLAIGQINVRSLTAKVLESSFTDWATGAAVIVLEEMKQHGHNRYDVMNALKPLITNDIVEIHPKGRAPYMAPNTANYLLLSNFMDGAPVTDGDRRYMFLRSAITLSEVKQMSAGGYYGRLFGGVRDRPEAIRGWLLGYQLHPEFCPEDRAPDTFVRAAVIESVKSDLEMAVDDILEEDTFVFNDLLTELRLAGVQVQDRSLSAVLGKKGYRFVARLSIDGRRIRVWTNQKEVDLEAFAAHLPR
jgi:hypothetical protein